MCHECKMITTNMTILSLLTILTGVDYWATILDTWHCYGKLKQHKQGAALNPALGAAAPDLQLTNAWTHYRHSILYEYIYIYKERERLME